MKRAILMTTSTVVGVASVLAYQPNSDVASAMLDLTGVSNATSATSEATAPTPSAPDTAAQAATASATAAKSATAATRPTKGAPQTTPTQPATKTAASKPTTAQSDETAATQPAPAANTQSAQPAAPAAATRMLTGDAYAAMHGFSNYGQVVVTVTLTGNKMTDISVSQSRYGSGDWIRAVRQYLVPAVLQAQNVNVGYVSGATATSDAFAKSLQSALNKA